MFHLLAYNATGVANTDVDMTPVADGLMTIQNGHFLPQSDGKLLWAYSGGLTQSRTRIVTPTLRQIVNPYIRPLDNAAHPVGLPGFARYNLNPLTLKGLEEISVFMQNTSTAVCNALLGLSLTPMMPAPQGNIFTIRGTGTTTLTALGWSIVSATWSDTLPSGNYVCVGLSAFSATCIGARLTFEGQWERPGCLGTDLVTSQEWPYFHNGNLGVWGNFHSYRMPSLEFLSVSADTAQTVFMDLIRVG
jgi:hypothetical protein